MNKNKSLLLVSSALTVAMFVIAFSFQPVRAAYTGVIQYITGAGGYGNATTTVSNVQNTITLGQYTSGTRVLTEGQFSAWPLDSNGFPIVTLGIKPPGWDTQYDVTKVEQRFTGYTTTTNGTANAVVSGASYIDGCVLSGTNGTTVSLYDALTVTGTPFKVINNYATSSEVSVTLHRNIVTGLTIVTSGNQAPNLYCGIR